MPGSETPDFDRPKCGTALLVLDLFSDFEFPDARAVLRAARSILPSVVRLRGRARAAGAAIAQALAPAENEAVIPKPRHSGFHATPLGALLEQAQVRR